MRYLFFLFFFLSQNIQANFEKIRKHILGYRQEKISSYLEKDFSFYEMDDEGNSLFHIAALCGDFLTIKKIGEKLKKFQENSGYFYFRREEDFLNKKNFYGQTPLHIAAQNCHPVEIEALIEIGADLNAKDVLGLTPLHLAIAAGDSDSVNILLNHGALVTLYDGMTPLDLAAAHSHMHLFSLLKNLNIHPEIPSSEEAEDSSGLYIGL